MADIFLSYRRSDAAGHVGRLADSLVQVFGEGSVYRDVDSERAGGNWKKSIARSVAGAQIVIAMIGPRWQELLNDREPGQDDWTHFELAQARNLDIPVIPVLYGGATFEHEASLGDLSWLTDIQFFDLADGQGRWQTDLDRLAQEIARLTTLEMTTAEMNKSTPVHQQSHGNQSPNVISEGGDINISFGADKENS